MKSSPNSIIQRILSIFISMLALALLTWIFVEKRNELAEEREREKPTVIPSRVRKINETEAQVFIDAKTQALAGIQTTSANPNGHEVLVPRTAILRNDGKAWVYLQISPEVFGKKEVTLSRTTKDAWIISSGVSFKDRIVTQGAQMLLSEELRKEIKVGDEN